jgi:DNA mismatch endonuclease (patch repair protein)
VVDIFDPQKRSYVMSRIKGRNNLTTELLLVSLFRAERLRGWRRHLPLPGTPDFTFLEERLCIFVHGCFWHGCPVCRKTSATNPEFWNAKIDANRRRDRRVVRVLRAKNYVVMTIWECSLRKHRRLSIINRLKRLLVRQTKLLSVSRRLCRGG